MDGQPRKMIEAQTQVATQRSLLRVSEVEKLKMNDDDKVGTPCREEKHRSSQPQQPAQEDGGGYLGLRYFNKLTTRHKSLTINIV
jgi:hypothetical protein